MELTTASAVIGFARKLEEDGAQFYEYLLRRYARDEDVFRAFARENGKNRSQVERAYYEVISDAIEGCFSFNIQPDEYAFDTELAADTSYSAALAKALEMEQGMIRFYLDAAEQSKSLMADVPRAFARIARKREERGLKLRSLLQAETSEMT